MEGARLLQAANAGAVPAWEGDRFAGGIRALYWVAVVISRHQAGGKAAGVGPRPRPAAGIAGVKPGALCPAGEGCRLAVASGQTQRRLVKAKARRRLSVISGVSLWVRILISHMTLSVESRVAEKAGVVARRDLMARVGAECGIVNSVLLTTLAHGLVVLLGGVGRHALTTSQQTGGHGREGSEESQP